MSSIKVEEIDKIELNHKDWWQPKIDKKVYKQLCQRSDAKAWFHTILYFGLLFITGLIAIYSWGTWYAIPAFILYGSVYACSNARWHEYGHRTVFKSRKLNDFFYYISSFIAFFEPISWRWSHANHHSKTRYLDLDIEIADPRPTNLRILFFTEFFGYYRVKAELQKIFKHSLRIFTSQNSFSDEEAKISVADLVPDREKNKMVWSSRIFVGIIFLTIALSIILQSFLPLLLIITPQIYGGPLLWILAFPQHAAMKFDSHDHRETTRTVILGPILGTFFYANMQYHIEHHSCPQIPFYNLPKFHELIKDQLPEPNKGLVDAYLEIIPAVIKQAKDPNYEIKKFIPA